MGQNGIISVTRLRETCELRQCPVCLPPKPLYITIQLYEKTAQKKEDYNNLRSHSIREKRHGGTIGKKVQR